MSAQNLPRTAAALRAYALAVLARDAAYDRHPHGYPVLLTTDTSGPRRAASVWLGLLLPGQRFGTPLARQPVHGYHRGSNPGTATHPKVVRCIPIHTHCYGRRFQYFGRLRVPQVTDSVSSSTK
ncbi:MULTISPECIES: hypothetical protein [Protofrankia]|uniref:Uncharacterized protein n=1 Tax=Candidatus Protofrankia datiscae TaxID=2716812 RepID=F8B2C5_9ACTN|nr:MULTISPECIES: hypothetical protein [Protofrankia]AEH10802.1 hypothetical protein FsymDg_3519 [Candidatus Protofrankia datiscae]